eukprot:GFUD01009248.1.p1 GENE.GFUD01009248.1~~GFUD01009248.1.p1  ORF type:complete len:196 (-),score=43.98 GFUD01009248.1:58-645(-)
MTNKVHYERVNLADIDTSSDEDDYGDLFAAERGRIVKGRPKVAPRKKGKSCGGGCIKGLCVLFSVLLLLLMMAGVAIYMDPGENTDIVGEGHEDSAKNVTSIDVVEAEAVKEEINVGNSTEADPIVTSGFEAEELSLNVTSEKPLSESDIEKTIDADLNKLESWSSSMASGNLNRSTRSNPMIDPGYQGYQGSNE